MSHTTYVPENKQQKHPKVNFRQYLSNSDEPRDDIFGSTSYPEIEAEMLVSSRIVKRRIRRAAQRLRKQYSL